MTTTITTFSILVFADDSFEQLSWRRAAKRYGAQFDTSYAHTMAELEQALAGNKEDAIDVAVVDFDALGDLGRAASRLLVEQTLIPVIGLFGVGETRQAADALVEGVDGAVLRQPTGNVLDLLAANVIRLGQGRAAQGKFDQLRNQIKTFKRERHALLNASLTLVTCHQVDTRILWSNAYEDNQEAGAVDYLVGRFAKEIWKNGGMPNGKCPVATAVETGDSVEAEVTTLDGYTMLQRAYPVKDDDGKVVGVLASTLDMSAVSPAQEAMRTAARIQASATLAGGIAHKFNNLMAAVLGNVSLLFQDLPKGDETRDLLREIEHAATTAGALSEQLLAFARGGKYLPRRIDLNQVIVETLQTQAHRAPESISVNHVLDSGLWPIEANAAQLGLLLSQVITNSVEAIEARDGGTDKGGVITVSTENVEVTDSVHSKQPWLRDGRYVLLTVTDNGCGMSPKVRKKIFEPFFTTKKKGRGLGLSGAYGIVRSHEGHIFVESELGVGTVVRVHLPASNVEELPIEPVSTAVGDEQDNNVVALARSGETVLVVDDESVLRRAISRLLTRLGYTVLQAADGGAAVSLAGSHNGPIHVTLLDMIMPGLDGMDVYRQLKASRPKMEIVVMSGYDQETYGDALVEAGAAAFLQKPVPMELFAQTIREVLDK